MLGRPFARRVVIHVISKFLHYKLKGFVSSKNLYLLCKFTQNSIIRNLSQNMSGGRKVDLSLRAIKKPTTDAADRGIIRVL